MVMQGAVVDAIKKEQGSKSAPLAHTLVIVESPTKAKTIRGFLPKGFQVEASMGHVRDLPNNASEIPASAKGQKWANLGVNTEADFEPLYVVPKDKKKVVRELKDALKGADQLLLATDEDREGEHQLAPAAASVSQNSCQADGVPRDHQRGDRQGPRSDP